MKHMKHLKTFEQMENPYEIMVKEGDPVLIGYRKDIESGNTDLTNGYRTGTVHISQKEMENRGSEDFSSPFHTGQVIPDDDYSEEDMIEEMDFTFNPRISNEIINKKLEEIVEKDYNNCKIVKTYYH